MKRWKILVICFSVLGVISLSIRKDHFQEVIDHQTNEIVKERLIDFRKKGIEKTIDVKHCDTEEIITTATSYLHAPHRMGGTSRKGIDCSGLVMVSFLSQQIKLPHSSQEQARYGKVISSIDQLKRGDLVFFYDSYKTSSLITHSGIYLGENDFIHTSNSKGVMISQVNDPAYWGPRFLFGTRIR